MIKKILPLFIVLTILSAQIEFSEGPYGAEYFDIAGPFTIVLHQFAPLAPWHCLVLLDIVFSEAAHARYHAQGSQTI